MPPPRRHLLKWLLQSIYSHRHSLLLLLWSCLCRTTLHWFRVGIFCKADSGYSDPIFKITDDIQVDYDSITHQTIFLNFSMLRWKWNCGTYTLYTGKLVFYYTMFSLCPNGTLTPLSVLRRSHPLANLKLRLLSKKHHPWELSSPDRDYCLQHHIGCHSYSGMLVLRHLIIWLRHSSIRSCLYT